jgi:hypothetical protein
MATDAAYLKKLMRRKYWQGPGTSGKWEVLKRVQHGLDLHLLTKSGTDFAVFSFYLPKLTPRQVPSDKFAGCEADANALFASLCAPAPMMLTREQAAFREKVRTAVNDAYYAQERKTSDRDVKRAVHEAVWHVYGLLCDNPELVENATRVTFADVTRLEKSMRRAAR